LLCSAARCDEERRDAVSAAHQVPQPCLRCSAALPAAIPLQSASHVAARLRRFAPIGAGRRRQCLPDELSPMHRCLSAVQSSTTVRAIHDDRHRHEEELAATRAALRAAEVGIGETAHREKMREVRRHCRRSALRCSALHCSALHCTGLGHVAQRLCH
jgi:hypothetical protein